MNREQKLKFLEQFQVDTLPEVLQKLVSGETLTEAEIARADKLIASLHKKTAKPDKSMPGMTEDEMVEFLQPFPEESFPEPVRKFMDDEDLTEAEMLKCQKFIQNLKDATKK